MQESPAAAQLNSSERVKIVSAQKRKGKSSVKDIPGTRRINRLQFKRRGVMESGAIPGEYSKSPQGRSTQTASEAGSHGRQGYGQVILAANPRREIPGGYGVIHILK